MDGADLKRGILDGASVGALLTAPLVAVSYLAWKLAGLPFAPFDIFDWIARGLPGPVVTFGIDSLVNVSRFLHLSSTGVAAKTAEQTMAIAMMFAAGAVAGAALFGVLRLSGEPALLFGVILGTVLGGVALLIEQEMNRIPGGSFIHGSWVVATFLAWGLVFGWVHDRLRQAGEHATDRRPAAEAAEEGVDRRRFLIRFGVTTAATTFIGALSGMVAGRRQGVDAGQRWSANHALPNEGALIAAAPGTRPELTPLERHYRIDTDTRAPVVDGRRWRLKIGGMVESPLELTLDELRRYEPVHQFVTLACISNPVGGDLIGTTRWTGVSLQRLLPRFVVKPGATHLKITSTDGFHEVIALDIITRDPRVMLTHAWDGVPLPAEHGFPLRVYIPDVYGMKQPKWIQAIDAIDRWEPGFWVARGWDPEGQMKATAVVDTIALGAKISGVNGHALVPLGGIAHAGARGISRVEVQVDDGEWREAQLRDPLSDTTWVVWRADVPMPQGDHTVGVRCYDGNGAPQIAGLHLKRAKV
jgi:DMSO/TMAO reductase YedYZ molybdopterin-dependent catalytic subunit